MNEFSWIHGVKEGDVVVKRSPDPLTEDWIYDIVKVTGVSKKSLYVNGERYSKKDGIRRLGNGFYISPHSKKIERLLQPNDENMKYVGLYREAIIEHLDEWHSILDTLPTSTLRIIEAQYRIQCNHIKL